MIRDRSFIGLVVAVLLAIAVSTWLRSAVYAGLVEYAAVLGLFALSVNLVFGTLGYVTFGHAAFLGLGAYAAGLVTQAFGLNFWWTVPIAIVPGVLLGAMLGLASIRLGGAYFAIASLTVAEILRLVAANWVDLTRGPMGLVVMPAALPGSWHHISPQAGFLGLVLVVLAVTVFVLHRLQQSPIGRAWTAIRQSLPLAESIGIPTLRYRVANLALSGGLASLAGALLVPKILVLTPDLFGPVYSATGLLAVILGGRGTLLGPLLGGVIFAVLPEWLRFLGDMRLAVFALLLLIVVRVLPGGVASLLPRRWSRTRSDSDSDLKASPATAPASLAARQAIPSEASQPRGELLLEVKGIAKSFRGLRALSGVDMKLHASEVIGLIGPNGAGKSTCLNVLSGYFAPDEGEIRLLGDSVVGAPSHEMARRGLVRTFQQTTLFGALTAMENVLIATHLAAPENAVSSVFRTRRFLGRESERTRRARVAIDRVGLGERAHALASSLSYGEQRMLAIASALAAGPRVLLLDEPAAGLNHTEATALAGLIRTLREEGMGVVIIDHNLKMIMSLCDQVVVLHHGEKIASGLPQDVCNDEAVVRAYMGGVMEAAHA